MIILLQFVIVPNPELWAVFKEQDFWEQTQTHTHIFVIFLDNVNTRIIACSVL